MKSINVFASRHVVRGDDDREAVSAAGLEREEKKLVAH
jgi:hypothetical protein